jgi:tRNA-dihydrouridine synthase
VINKIRALCSWYSKGFDCGSHFRVRVNSCESVAHLRDIIDEFFFSDARMAAVPSVAPFVQSV